MDRALLLSEVRAKKKKLCPNEALQKTHRLLGKNIIIQEDPLGGVGGSIWEAVLNLMGVIEREEVGLSLEGWRGKLVVELGAGTGIAGIALALRGAQVTLTDQREVLDLLQLNVDLNFPSNQQTLRPSIAELPWGGSGSLKPIFDYMIVSECIYNLLNGDVLLASMVSLSNKNTVILFAYTQRNPTKEAEFFEKVRAFFDIDQLFPASSTTNSSETTTTTTEKDSLITFVLKFYGKKT